MTDMDVAAAADLGVMQSAWRALRDDWGLSEREIDDLLPAGGSGRARPPRDTEARMRLLVQINNRVGLDDHALRDALRLASPALGWLTPLEAMAGGIGDLRRVRDYADMGLLR